MNSYIGSEISLIIGTLIVFYIIGVVVVTKYVNKEKIVTIKRKLIFSGIGLLTCIFVGGIFFYNYMEETPDSFRDKKWGSSIEEYPNLVKVFDSEERQQFGIKNAYYEDLRDHANPVKFSEYYKSRRILYKFTDGKLVGVKIIFPVSNTHYNKSIGKWVGYNHNNYKVFLKEQHQFFVEMLSAKYGIARKEENYQAWDGYKTRFELDNYSNYDNDLILWMFGTQIDAEFYKKADDAYNESQQERKKEEKIRKDEYQKKIIEAGKSL